MAENGLKVSPDVMKGHGETAAKMTEEFKTQTQDFKTQKNSLMQIWKGQSATEFDEAGEIQIQKLEEFNDIMYAFSEAIKKGAEAYIKTEEENTLESRKLKDTDYNY